MNTLYTSLIEFIQDLEDIDDVQRENYLKTLRSLENGAEPENSEDFMDLVTLIDEKFWALEEKAIMEKDTDALEALTKVREDKNKLMKAIQGE